jgi:hypothetical protein
MPEDPVQILEMRADGAQRHVTVTAAVTAGAGHAIFIALSEQLDRRRSLPTVTVEDVLALRQQTELVERFAPLATRGEHAIVQFKEEELRDCVLELTDYQARVDGEHFQPVDLRRRLQLIAEITATLWDASATAAAASGGLLSPAAQ